MTIFSIELTSVPDRKNLVSEVWFGDELLAELNVESGDVRIQIFAPKDGYWDFDFEEFLSAVNKAKERVKIPD
jgi:hypothetical protein